MQPYATIDDVFRAAESGQTDHAVVPVENSTEGAVGRTLDLMFQTPLVICGEIRLRVRQYLLSAAATTAEITSVYSHPQSLAQCVQWLARHLPNAAPIPVASNAEAARLAATEPGRPPLPGRAPPRSTAQHSRAAHRGRPQQHDALLGAGRNRVPPSGATRRRS
jgi:chorismate mutase/prephenate dehydratase